MPVGKSASYDVAVIGAGNSAGQAAMYLSESYPDRQVHLLIRKRIGPGSGIGLQRLLYERVERSRVE
jgi:ribulose 1,5-bisphosphate synthetase/thiazole synthase